MGSRLETLAKTGELYQRLLALETAGDWYALLLENPIERSNTSACFTACSLLPFVHVNSRYPVVKSIVHAFANTRADPNICVEKILRLNHAARPYTDAEFVCRDKAQRVWMPMKYWTRDSSLRVSTDPDCVQLKSFLKCMLQANFLCNTCTLLRELPFQSVVGILTEENSSNQVPHPLYEPAFCVLRDRAPDLLSALTDEEWDRSTALLPALPNSRAFNGERFWWEPGPDQFSSQIRFRHESDSASRVVLSHGSRDEENPSVWRVNIAEATLRAVFVIDSVWPHEGIPYAFQDTVVQKMMRVRQE